ncbi:MAG: hypothetical protein ACKO02_12230 [Cyanobium sp.]
MASRMVFLPPTTDFPPDPEPLSREDINSVYLELRNCYKSSMRSRGQHRSLASKAREETVQLKQRLLDLAAREASVRTDIYQMLEIVTAIAGDLEDAGDDIVNEFGRYKLGRKTYQGGSFLGGLVQAVIRFINRWTHTKERVVQLDQKRQEFIEKTKDLPPFTLGGNGHGGPVNQPELSVPAKVEIVDSPAVQQAQEVKADGTTH